MVKTSDSAALNTSDCKRNTPVHAVLVKHPYFALRVTEDDKVFTEQFGAKRITVWVRQLLRSTDRVPVAAHCLAHWRRWTHTGECFIVGSTDHFELQILKKGFPRETI
jgi:hypothetical protein